MKQTALYLHQSQIESIQPLIDRMYRPGAPIPQCLAAQVFVVSPYCAQLRIKYYSRLSAWIVYAALWLATRLERMGL